MKKSSQEHSLWRARARRFAGGKVDRNLQSRLLGRRQKWFVTAWPDLTWPDLKEVGARLSTATAFSALGFERELLAAPNRVLACWARTPTSVRTCRVSTMRRSPRKAPGPYFHTGLTWELIPDSSIQRLVLGRNSDVIRDDESNGIITKLINFFYVEQWRRWVKREMRIELSLTIQ